VEGMERVSLMCIGITWLWPCGRKGTSFLDVHGDYMVVAM